MTTSPPIRVRTDEGADPSNRMLSKALQNWLTTYGPNGIFKTCGNCRHMAKAGAPTFCNLYQITPPVEVVIHGCPSHEDEDEIPF
jgi:hypothetical protein